MTYQLDGVMFKKVIYQLVFWWHFWLFFSVEHCTISATKWIFFVEPDDDKLQREFCTNKLVTKCCLQSASKRSLEDNSKSSFLYSATCYLTYVWETVESSFEKKNIQWEGYLATWRFSHHFEAHLSEWRKLQSVSYSFPVDDASWLGNHANLSSNRAMNDLLVN